MIYVYIQKQNASDDNMFNADGIINTKLYLLLVCFFVYFKGVICFTICVIQFKYLKPEHA